MRLWFYRRRQRRNRPLLAPGAVKLLDRRLGPKHAGLEWGSGYSTFWFAERLGSLVTVEHDPGWHEWVQEQIRSRHDWEVECLLRDIFTADPSRSPYVTVADQFEDESLDFCLVDGRLREHCANAIAPKIRPGGLLVLDDAQRYVKPGHNGEPFTETGRANGEWKEFLRRVKGWECTWMRSPLRKTAVWTRPR